jgi:4-amino-4-deoxy-L-arabinose transferase-like glycosyltransferase
LTDHTLLAERERTRSLRRWPGPTPLAGIGACLLLAALVINPFREALTVADDWAYARTVEHLLRTGEYRLDNWAAANMPVQIYLAGALSKIFGYSLSLLRLSTVGLLALGVASFYGLARELGVERRTSFAATLALLASPLVMLLGFTFMSDVHFLGWMIAALFLYVRGLRRDSDTLAFLGSVAAACAVGTRQFGLVLTVGWLIAWILCRRENRPRLRTMLLATVLPVVAVGWQILIGVQKPVFSQVVRLDQERVYLAEPPAVLAHDSLWRVAILLQYLGISLLPALPLVVATALACAGKSRRTAQRVALLASLICFALCAILLIGGPLTGQMDRPPRLWPAMGLWWLLTNEVPPQLFRPLDFAGLAVAGTLGAVALHSAPALRSIRRISPETILLVATPACLLGLHLLYVQLNDTYVVPFVAFALLLLAVHSRGSSGAPRLAAASTALSLTTLLLMSLWIRSDLAEQSAYWAAANRLTQAGVAAAEIDDEGTGGTWPGYRGAFDDWLAAGKPGYELTLERVGRDSLHEPFRTWLNNRDRHAAYRVQDVPTSEPGWRLIARDSYFDHFFQRREVFTYQAVAPTTTAGPASGRPE